MKIYLHSIGNIKPIPPVLEAVIDHLVQWRLIPVGRRPNSCIINFFDEVYLLFNVKFDKYNPSSEFHHGPKVSHFMQDEYSQPYFKPPHLDNPISTLVLSETTLAFGRVLASDPNGNYKGSLTLPLKEGYASISFGCFHSENFAYPKCLLGFGA